MTINGFTDYETHLLKKVAELEAKLALAKEALEFYASQGAAMACGACIEDGGDKAREALEKLK